MELNVSTADLGIAFRKAKVDFYYSINPSFFAIADYEGILEDYLQRLQSKINGRSTTWGKDPGFRGSWTLALKAIKSAEQVDAKLHHHCSPEDKRPRSHRAEDQWRESKTDNHDCGVTSKIHVAASRQRRFSRRSKKEGLKRLPDGFAADMLKDREVLSKRGA